MGAFSITAPSVTFEHAALRGPVVLHHTPDGPLPTDADGTCRRLWPTSFVLAHYLSDHPELVRGKRVVELGSGSGAVGLVCAALGAASVTLTDMPEALPLISENAGRNAASCEGAVHVSACAWGEPAHLEALLVDGPYDVVLCCEVVYHQAPEVLEALVRTQHELASPSGSVLLGYEFRGDLLDDLVYFEAAGALLGDPTTTPLRADIASLTGTSDDGADDRMLYVYSRAPPPRRLPLAGEPAAP